jgi:hypothetical protein
MTMSKTIPDRRSRRRTAALATIGVALASLGLTACTRFGATLARPEDPVVLSGASTPKLLGALPSRVVAYAWDGSAWHQIPVQVDERDLVSPGKILNRPTSTWPKVADGGATYRILAYTTPTSAAAGLSWTDTYTGADSDPTLDTNDEIVFLADDTGQQAPTGTGAPANVDAGTREDVKVIDPLSPGATGYVSLFRSTSAALTGGSAGTTGVSYVFSLDSGAYKATYKMGTAALAPNNGAGFNPEHSSITTPFYRQTYGDRWLNDGIRITTGSSNGADLLERGRAQFPGSCGRSEDTFDGAVTSPYEGAFIANISGPVRAIRSYMGANSGQYTAATDVFYPKREDSITDLRVHTIPGVLQFDDFTTGLPLQYSDDQNSDVTIDGHADTIAAAHPAPWQMVSGAAGSLVTTRVMDTSIAGLALSTYYLDQNPASPAPCTGDAAAWGQSGVRVLGPGGGQIPCTDPTIPSCTSTDHLTGTRVRYFVAPGLPVPSAAALAGHGTTPLVTTVTG